ncbi:hypothetical protein [Nevskia soli]|uniref:hypothetical protein n=1 Tax=Nevskia soli TaxID=418856 RepID=UPI0004A7079B|nr:hypothetical protein [Nevskia soli]
MAGLFSKGGTPLTPAQLQLQQSALQQAQNVSSVWMPVQSYFAQKMRNEAPGLQEMERGAAAATARTQGAGTTVGAAMADSNAGASAGSGRFVADLGRGFDATAGATGGGLTAATAAAQRHYAAGLQEILGIGQHDQDIGMQGLQQASNAEAQEAGAAQQGDAATRQTYTQLAGLALAFA